MLPRPRSTRPQFRRNAPENWPRSKPGITLEILIGLAVMLCLPAYLVAQALALFHWPIRISVVPLLVMGAAFATFCVGLAQGSTLAPLFMVLVAPFCLGWLWVARLIRR